MGRIGTKLKMKRIMPYISTKLPKVQQNEPFEKYKVRLPHRLKHMPDDVLEQWPFEVDIVQEALNKVENLVYWRYQLVELTSDEVLNIRHYPYDERRLFPKAYEWLMPEGLPLRPVWYDLMIAQGTFIRPIIVAHNASHQTHPVLSMEYGNLGPMLAPYHLLEGNRRLSLLRAMIESDMKGIKDRHLVWLVDMSRNR